MSRMAKSGHPSGRSATKKTRVEPPVKITWDSCLVPNPNVFLREEDDVGGILFDADTGATRLLNESAAATWKLLDGRRTLAEVVSTLRKKFDGVDAQAEKEVLALARDLYRLGAVGLRAEKAR